MNDFPDEDLDAPPEHLREKIENIGKEWAEIHNRFVMEIENMVKKYGDSSQIRVVFLSEDGKNKVSIYNPMLDLTGLK